MSAHILLVEDDLTVRMLMGATLEHAGHQVTSASDGEEALECLERASYQVVITDMQLGLVDGLQVLQVARRYQQPPEVILLTGNGTMETAMAALREGAFDYLLKPCGRAALLDCVARAEERYDSGKKRAEALNLISSMIKHFGNGIALPASGELLLPSTSVLRVGLLQIDDSQQSISFDGRPLAATPTEFALLRALASTPGQVVRYRDLVCATHNYELSDGEALVLLKPHVRNLRRKIPPAYLVNARNTGYMLIDPQQPDPSIG